MSGFDATANANLLTDVGNVDKFINATGPVVPRYGANYPSARDLAATLSALNSTAGTSAAAAAISATNAHTSELNAIAAASAVAATAIPLYAASVNSAVGSGSLKCLFDMDGPRTTYSSTVTMTIATPGVVTWTAHGLNNGDIVFLTTTGALPTGYAVGIGYYLVNKASNTFQLSATSGGSAINTTGTQSGVHTASLSANIITTLQSLDATPLTLGLFTTLFSGPNPRPIYTAGRGIYMAANSGLQMANGLLSKTSGDFAILYAVDLNTVTGTVATKAALSSTVDGEMYLVNADTNTTFAPDIVEVLDQAFDDATLVNGYWKYASASATFVGTGGYHLLAIKGVSSFIKIFLNHLGQLYGIIYSGSGGAVATLTLGTVMMGQSKVMVGIRRLGDQFCLYVNGKSFNINTLFGQSNITDFATLYLNGDTRLASTAGPIVTGVQCFMKGLVVVDDLPEANFVELHNVMAARHAMPMMIVPKQAMGHISDGQSWTQGATGTGTVGTGDFLSATVSGNSWDGMITPNNMFNSGEPNNVTREVFSNVFASSINDSPVTSPSMGAADIGNYQITIANSGNQLSSSHAPNSTGENFVAGMMRQLNGHRMGPLYDHYLAGTGQGGASIAILSFRSDPTLLVRTLKTAVLVGNDYYYKILRQVLYQQDKAWSKGQPYRVAAIDWQQGQTDTPSGTYLTDLYALMDQFCADLRLLVPGQGADPYMFMPQLSYSDNGARCISNTGTCIDQMFLDAEDQRGTRALYCIGPMYQITHHIHPPRLGHRWIGEIWGRTKRRVMFDGEAFASLRSYAYTYIADGAHNTIDVDYRVRTGRALTFIDQNDNNIAARRAINGVDTYGYEYYRRILGSPTVGGASGNTVTVSASTGVVSTSTAHGLANGDKVMWDNIGVLPTGYTNLVEYFVINSTTNTFGLAATSGGSQIAVSGTSSGRNYLLDTTVKIASVAITSTNRVRITLDTNISATVKGYIKYLGHQTPYGNLCDGAKVDGIYPYQDFAGATWASNEPTFKLGPVNDLRAYGSAFTKAL